MKVGLLGAGRIGELHADLLHASERVGSITVYDAIADRAHRLAERIGGSAADDARSVVESVEALVIASSTDTHAGMLELAAVAGVPTFCEKPIALTRDDTDRAIAAVEQARLPVQMGFNRRFDPGFAAARDAVAGGQVGRVLSIVSHHHDHRPPPDVYIPVSGGQFKDQLIHDIDLVRFVSGDEVVRVFSAGHAEGFEVFARSGDSAVVSVVLWLSSGCLATMHGARVDPVGYDVRMEIFGTGDSVAVGWDSRSPIRSLEPGVAPPSDPYREWLDRFGESYAREIDVFLDVAEGKSDSPCTVYDARAALVVADACRVSLDQRVPVAVEAA